MYDFIVTATGKKVAVDMVSLNPDPQILYIRVVGKSISETSKIFEDPQETIKLTYGGKEIYGFTKISSITNQGEAVRVSLKRP